MADVKENTIRDVLIKHEEGKEQEGNLIGLCDNGCDAEEERRDGEI